MLAATRQVVVEQALLLRNALADITARYRSLLDSGDAGNFDDDFIVEAEKTVEAYDQFIKDNPQLRPKIMLSMAFFRETGVLQKHVTVEHRKDDILNRILLRSFVESHINRNLRQYNLEGGRVEVSFILDDKRVQACFDIQGEELGKKPTKRKGKPPETECEICGHVLRDCVCDEEGEEEEDDE